MSDLSRQWATLDPAKRRLVEAALRKKGVDPARLPIEARPHDAPAPLSLAQERLWILARMAPDSTVYNETYRAQFDAAHLDAEALGHAWRQLSDRQRLLRARFAVDDDGDGVLTTDGAEPPWQVIDLSTEVDPAAAFETLLADMGAQAFDLEQGPVARATLARLGDGRWGFVLSLHHIICDGASILLIANELSALYGAEIGGHASADPPVLPALPIHYADYAHWQRRLLLPMLAGAPLDAWCDRLAGAPTVLTLPTDHPRPPVQSYRGDTVATILPRSLDARMADFAREHGATPFMVLLAAFGALLGRYTGQTDLLIGSPVDTRDRDELRSLVGFFVNTVALRLDMAGNPTAETLVARVRSTVLEAFERRAVPFAKVVERLEPERSPGHAPLVQVLFIVQPSPAEVTESEGLALGLRPVDNGTSKFDLTAVLRRRDDGLEMRVQYASDLFERATMTRFLGHYRTLLEGMLDRLQAAIVDLPMLTRDEREALQQWNASGDDRIPGDRTWTQLFRAQVAATPDATAVESDTETLTYRALDVRANQLGHRLRQLGVGPEVPVGVALGHGVDMVVALLGIFAAGGAYVPLDPSYPADRLRVMVSAAELGLIVADAAAHAVLPGVVPSSAARTVVLAGGTLDDGTGPRSFVDPGNEQPPSSTDDPDGLAYLIFTSGSTGIPKAVMVSHRSLVNLALNFVETFQLGPGERLLMMLSLSFDASVGDIFPPLVAGASVVLHPQPSSLGGSALWRTLEGGRISVIELSAVFWQQWVDELARRGRRVPSALRTVVTGGDSADVEKVRTWFSLADHPTRVLNNYGPTEATVCSAYLPVDSERLATLTTPRLPIGGPMSNIELHVLDDRGQPLPVLVPGELAIGGRGVARGYFGQPDATARAFVPDPFSARPGVRLYCTGDLARRLADGTLEFLGRIDHQAKIRGFRIEPGEIEVALIGHPAVREAAAKAVGARAEDRRLVAYLVAEPDTEAPDLAALRSYLADRLPAHMVPSAVVTLDALPMTATGKVDRKALPEPGDPGTDSGRFTPPRDRVETMIADAWCTVLKREQIGIFDNVFDLGAHSLLVLKVQGLLEDALGREIPILDFFRFPTIDALARGLAGEAAPTTSEQTHRTTVRRNQAATEIAIVGMAGRFPDAPDVDTFWRNLCTGVEAITTFGDDALEAAGYSAEALAQPGMVKAKGVLSRGNGADATTDTTDGYGVEYFDAAHFGFHPREAELLDPQHRHFLEVAWEALERAGHDPARFPGLIGVFAGCGRNAYLFNNLWGRPNLLLESGIAQTMIGNDKDFLPTRVSYKLGLGGPSFAVQSACSTSLVATHVACRALLDGECDLALVGGVTIPVPQISAQVVEAGGIFSPDGHCRAFAADAAGTVPGSGAGVVVLRRLDDALADGDRVHAVVLGSAVSNDGGHKVGYTAPAIEGQARAIRQALARAEIEPATVGFVETHGTGTALGDAIEVEALQQAYDTGARTTPLRLGAVKSNIGHLDTAAGVAGLIKTALVLEHGHIPPSLHCTVPNPALHLDDKGLALVPEAVDWKPDDGPRRAGLSSFGLGGTNAHVVLEQAGARSPSDPGRRAELLVLSARVRSALDRATTRLAEHLRANPETPLADVAYTLQLGRREMAHRRIVVATSSADAAGALGGTAPGRLRSAVHDGHPRPVVFLFPGQGAQYPGMARRLYAEEPEVRRWIDRAADVLAPLLDGDLRAVLGVTAAAEDQNPEDQAARLTETRWTQPALFAVEHAVGRLLLSWGVRPAALLGHSIGEWTAACLAETVDFDDAMRLVAARGRVMHAAAPGAMLGVSLDAETLDARLAEASANPEGARHGVELAAINGPRLCSVAGPAAAIDAFAAELAADGVEHRRLRVSHAFHSAMMDDAAAGFAAMLTADESPVTLRPPSIPWVSNVTGTWITDAQATDPAYWAHQLRATVRFAEGLATVAGAGDGTPPILLEVGPGNSLTTLARRALGRPDVATTLPHPARGGDDLIHLLEGLGELWLAGAAIDWRAFHGDQVRYRVPLPTYPFERHRFWIEPAQPIHAMVGDPSEVPDPAPDRGPAAADSVPSATTTVDPSAVVTEVPSGRHPRPALRNDYQAPASDLEQALAEQWQAAFAIEPVGRHDDFFELGGHSLMAVRLLDQIKRSHGQTLELDALFAAPTVAGLAAVLAATDDAGPQADPPVTPVPRTGRPLPVSSLQEEYCQLMARPLPGRHPFKAAATYRGRGRLHLDAMRLAFAKLIDRHEILRTTFVQENGRWCQRVHETVQQTLPVVDLRTLTPEQREAELVRRSLAVYYQPIALDTGPFFYLEVLRLTDDEWGLIRIVHRLLYDGQTSAILFGELENLYHGYCAGIEVEQPPPALHYGDFGHWQQQQIDDGSWDHHRDFWRQHLRGVPHEIALRTDRPHPAVRRGVGDRVPVALDAAAAEGLAVLGRSTNSSLFQTLASLYFPLLHRWTGGQDDLVVLTPISIRRPELSEVPGRFLAPVLLRVHVGDDPTFRDLVTRVREAALAAHKHRDWPLVRMAEDLAAPIGPRPPLAQVAFVTNDVPGHTFALGDLAIEPLPIDRKSADYELNLTFVRDDNGVTFDGFLEYDTDLFDDRTAVRMVQELDALVTAVLDDPDRRLSALRAEIDRRTANP